MTSEKQIADMAQIYANKFWLIVDLSMEAFDEQARQETKQENRPSIYLL